jgi:hypothetical protein
LVDTVTELLFQVNHCQIHALSTGFVNPAGASAKLHEVIMEQNQDISATHQNIRSSGDPIVWQSSDKVNLGD